MCISPTRRENHLFNLNDTYLSGWMLIVLINESQHLIRSPGKRLLFNLLPLPEETVEGKSPMPLLKWCTMDPLGAVGPEPGETLGTCRLQCLVDSPPTVGAGKGTSGVSGSRRKPLIHSLYPHKIADHST